MGHTADKIGAALGLLDAGPLPGIVAEGVIPSVSPDPLAVLGSAMPRVPRE